MRKLTVGGLVAVITLVMLAGSASLSPALPQVVEANAGTQWNASYYNNTSLSGAPVLQRIDDQINFDWGAGSPGGAVPADNFSARWTKTVNFPQTGKWIFRVGADDGVRMWIDVTPIVDEWHGNPEGYKLYEVSVDALTAGNHDLKVEYYEATGNAKVTVEWVYASGAGGGGSSNQVYGQASWNASYYNNPSLSGSPVLTRVDNAINFNWATGSPGAGVPADNFSARWTATVNFSTTGHWVFRVGADDGVRMWIDVTPIVDEWHSNPEGYRTYQVDVNGLTAGNHELKVEYYEATGNAGIQVQWWMVGGTGTTSAVDAPPPPPPPATVYAAPITQNVNVRSGPGQGNPVIARINYPRSYHVAGGVPDLSWLLIDLPDGSQGWVSNDWVWLYAQEEEKNQDTTGGGQPDFVDDIPRLYVSVAPPSELPPVEERVVLHGQATDTLNLRDGPSLYASKVIGAVPQGASFTVEACSRNAAWYLVNYQGVRGWVSALYVDLVDGYATDLLASSEVVPVPPMGEVFVPQTEDGEPITVRGRLTATLKLRDAASLRGNELGEVPTGTELVIEGRNTSGAWFLVTYEGQQGWIYSPEVTLIEGTVADLPIR